MRELGALLPAKLPALEPIREVCLPNKWIWLESHRPTPNEKPKVSGQWPGLAEPAQAED